MIISMLRKKSGKQSHSQQFPKQIPSNKPNQHE
jgi:hypothetical protein